MISKSKLIPIKSWTDPIALGRHDVWTMMYICNEQDDKFSNVYNTIYCCTCSCIHSYIVIDTIMIDNNIWFRQWSLAVFVAGRPSVDHRPSHSVWESGPAGETLRCPDEGNAARRTHGSGWSQQPGVHARHRIPREGHHPQENTVQDSAKTHHR